MNKTNTMDFFKRFISLFDAAKINITIAGKNDKYTISILPEGGPVKVQPLIVSGTIEELDNEFFDSITPGLTAAKGLTTNIEERNKELRELEASTSKKIEQKKQDKSKKPVEKKPSAKPSKPSKEKKSKAKPAKKAMKEEKGPKVEKLSMFDQDPSPAAEADDADPAEVIDEPAAAEE